MKILFTPLIILLMLCPRTWAQSVSGEDSIPLMLHDSMPEPFRMLPELFVTPDDSDPVDYILGHVARKAEENSRTLNYNAKASVTLSAKNMDIVPQLLSKTQNWMLKTILGMVGLRTTYNYVTRHEEVGIAFSYSQSAQKGKVRTYDKVITEAPEDMPDKVGEQVMKVADLNLFDVLYTDNDYLDQKKRHKNYIAEYRGTAEDQDGTVYYIISLVKSEGKKHKSVTTLHITEKDWGILRYEHRSPFSFMYVQCKNISGVYLPVHSVTDPTPISLSDLTKEAKKTLEQQREEKGKKKLPKSQRKLLERAERLIQGGRNGVPSLRYRISVSY